MDGASKFVKGDAIAGIIILLIDIVAGWIVGMMQMGMDWNQALQRFSLLTIGDGIATQLPALIIAVATGIIVTRSSSDRELSTELFHQLSSVPRIPLIVATVLLALLLLPGMPKWPILLIMGLAVYVWRRIRRTASAAADESADAAETATPGAAPVLEIRLGRELGEAWKKEEALIMDRIAGLRRVHEKDFGVGFPAVRLSDGEGIGSLDYEIRVFGSRFGMGEVNPDQMLALNPEQIEGLKLEGTPTRDPTFGVPAMWIDEASASNARQAGIKVVDPLTVLITHFSEIVRGETATLLTRSAVVSLLEQVRSRQPGLIEELIPNSLAISDVQRILQNLLAEGVSIANVDLIIEHLTDLARTQKEPGELTELLRQRLSYAICNKLQGMHGDLAVLSLDPRIENQIVTNAAQPGAASGLIVEPKTADQLIRKLSSLTEKMHIEGRAPVLLCGGEVRRQLKAFTRRAIPNLSVLSVNEIPMRINLSSFDVVRLEA
jgi:flagellar biosynthesis protein FlhA